MFSFPFFGNINSAIKMRLALLYPPPHTHISNSHQIIKVYTICNLHPCLLTPSLVLVLSKFKAPTSPFTTGFSIIELFESSLQSNGFLKKGPCIGACVPDIAFDNLAANNVRKSLFSYSEL